MNKNQLDRAMLMARDKMQSPDRAVQNEGELIRDLVDHIDNLDHQIQFLDRE